MADEIASTADNIQSILTKRVTAQEAASIIAGNTVQLQYLKMPLSFWLGQMLYNNDGTLAWPVTAGKVLSTDTYTPAITSATTFLKNTTPFSSVTTPLVTHQVRYGYKSWALDGSGNAAAAAIVPAAAGLTGCYELLGIYATAAGAETITVACTAGTIVGPTALAMTTIANKVQGWGGTNPPPIGVIGHATSNTDNGKDITISVAGALLTQTIWIYYRYWYEAAPPTN
jgi:hypothetical protein